MELFALWLLVNVPSVPVEIPLQIQVMQKAPECFPFCGDPTRFKNGTH